MTDAQIAEVLNSYNDMEPNCLIYWCDTRVSHMDTYWSRESLNDLLGPNAEPGASHSESLWMFPIWDCFEGASA